MTDEEVVYLDLDDIVRVHRRIFQMESTAARDRLRNPADSGGTFSAPLNSGAML